MWGRSLGFSQPSVKMETRVQTRHQAKLVAEEGFEPTTFTL